MAAVYQLLALPGTGKYTIAVEIVRQLTERGEHAVLLDNHATANLIWQLVPPGRRFDDEVLAKLWELRTVVLDAVDELAAADVSVVFTNFIPHNRPSTVVDRHRELAVRHGRKLVALELTCDPEELLRRVPGADRAARLKVTSVDRARQILAEGMSVPDWPEMSMMDTTGLSAEEAARMIIALADV